MFKVLALALALIVPMDFDGGRGVVVIRQMRSESEWVQFHMPRAYGFLKMEYGERVVIRGVHMDSFLSICLDEDGDGQFTLHERVFVTKGRRVEYTLR